MEIKRWKQEERELYIRDDVRSMSHFFEHAEERLREKGLIKNLCHKDFVENFMKSEIRHWMDLCHPRYITEASADLLDHYIETGVKFKEAEEEEYYAHRQLYWIGNMYAHIGVKTNMWSKDLIELIDFDSMCHYYVTGHQLFIADAYERINEKYKFKVHRGVKK